MKLFDSGVYLSKEKGLISADSKEASSFDARGREKTLSYNILKNHNTSGSMEKLCLKFDKLTSHDITYVGIIQTARASGLKEFPIPYILTNCHNSLCAVGGTINEDDHIFGLSAAKKYGGIYVPPHLAVIHQYAREMLSLSGGMILGSDSHTRYGALGTMAIGEGGPELVKQLLGRTYDINMPEVTAVYLKGSPRYGVGPMDIALHIIREVFPGNFVKNRIMEFVGPGVKNLSIDYRIGIDVMTTETACLSSIWESDDKVRDYYRIHGRECDYRELTSEEGAYYDRGIELDLSEVKPMIAMPFHPSNAYTIEELKENLEDILIDTERRAKVSFGEELNYSLLDKVKDHNFQVDQGIIAGCAGGGFENICDAADILDGGDTGNGGFSLSVYPASMPIYMELLKNGSAEKIIEAGAVIKTAFCGPCFGAGDTPANNGFSIRHSTRNFPNREGSKIQNGQIAYVALMDARSIAATAVNHGMLTSAEDMDVDFRKPVYYFDKNIYEKRVLNEFGKADPDEELRFGPNIKDWPDMRPLPENLILKVVSYITDPVTTTDELIPSGETSSLRSNPEALSEFALSRKDPGYVGRAKEVRKAELALLSGKDPENVLGEIDELLSRAENAVKEKRDSFGIGSAIFALKPGDGSAREQAASCQKVLGGWANIAEEYATKRYRSNLINWGILPLRTENRSDLMLGSYIFIPHIREQVLRGCCDIEAYLMEKDNMRKIDLILDELTEAERKIILDGCLINYYKAEN